MIIEDLIPELNSLSVDLLEEIQFVFQRYGVDTMIIDDHLDINELDMIGLTEEERYYLYQELYELVF